MGACKCPGQLPGRIAIGALSRTRKNKEYYRDSLRQFIYLGFAETNRQSEQN